MNGFIILKNELKCARVRIRNSDHPARILTLLAEVLTETDSRIESVINWLVINEIGELELITKGGQVRVKDLGCKYIDNIFHKISANLEQLVNNFEDYKDQTEQCDYNPYLDVFLYIIDMCQKTLTMHKGGYPEGIEPHGWGVAKIIEGPKELYEENCDDVIDDTANNGFFEEIINNNIRIEEAVRKLRDEGYLIGSIY